MKILAITSSYPRFEGDMAGNFVHEWVRHLRARGHQVRVLCWSDSSISKAQAAGNLGDVARIRYAPPGFDTLFYGAGTPENIREKPLRALLAVPAVGAMLGRVGREIIKDRPDLIVGHWLVPAGLIARVAGLAARIPSLIVGHSGGVHLLDTLPKPLGRRLADICAAGPMTLPTRALVDKFDRIRDGDARKNPGRPSPTILPMGFDISAPEDALDTPSDEPKNDWLCMGRLVEIKGVELAVEAFMAADLPRAPTLHIAGDGPDRPALEALAETLQTPDKPQRVEFHGIVTGPAKEKLFARAGFALFCSKTLDDGRHEGLPVSFLEASAHGLIPLCAPIPGITEYLADPPLQALPDPDRSAWHPVITRTAAFSAPDRHALSRAQMARVAPLLWPTLIARWDALLGEVVAGTPR